MFGGDQRPDEVRLQVLVRGPRGERGVIELRFFLGQPGHQSAGTGEVLEAEPAVVAGTENGHRFVPGDRISDRAEMEQLEFNELTLDQQLAYKESQAYVSEGVVTDEIKEDLLKLGWVTVEQSDVDD